MTCVCNLSCWEEDAKKLCSSTVAGIDPWFCLLTGAGGGASTCIPLMCWWTQSLRKKAGWSKQCRWDFHCISRRCGVLSINCIFHCTKREAQSTPNVQKQMSRTFLSRSRQVRRSCKIEVLPNVISYNSVCTSCERSGKWWMTLQILRTMRTKRIEASMLTYNSALAACEQAFQWEKTLGDALKPWHSPRAIRQSLMFPTTGFHMGFQVVPDLVNEGLPLFLPKN